MIVADVNLLAYLLIDGKFSVDARAVFQRDNHWTAPSLWRSELVNVLATNVRAGLLTLDDALTRLRTADAIVQPSTLPQSDREVIRLSVESRIATYDCSYAALSRSLGVQLVTEDRAILRSFPDVAVSMRDFVSNKI